MSTDQSPMPLEKQGAFSNKKRPLFTPSPWQISLPDDTVVIHIGKDGVHYEVASIDGDYNQPDTWPVMEANARLIAAAPELLEALCELRNALAGRVHSQPALSALAKADAAIAKAVQA